MEHALHAWLAQLLRIVPGASAGTVVAGDAPSGPWKPVVASAEPSEELLAAAAMAAESGRPVVRGKAPNEAWHALAAPIALEGPQRSAVAIAVAERPQPQLLAALATLQTSVAWLPALLAQGAAAKPSAASAPPNAPAAQASDLARDTLELVATCIDHEHFRAAATAIATELATRHQCERVSVGFLEGHEMRVEAVSHSARFDEKTLLLRAVADAMAEAADQQSVVLDPPSGDGGHSIRRAHEALREQGAGSICTVPISEHGEVIGAVTFESPANERLHGAFGDRVRPVIDLIGPILASRRREERGVIAGIVDLARDKLDDLRDPAHPGRKLALAGVVAGLLLSAVVPAPYRVSAPAHLEGTLQRAVVAPMDGFIAAAGARAGDLVKKGDSLGSLDDADILLERRKWTAQREQRSRELRAALAQHETARVPVLQAQVDQADAEVDLREELLQRTHLIAPFDGIVAKGDLSRSLGSPVARGDVLFEVAPVDRYRIILEVDESEIDEIAVGKSGELTLTALPSRRFPLAVERITPVATSEDARNYFRVEATLAGSVPGLRPGMEGVAKVGAGWRSVLWILSHSTFDWIRLWFWTRIP